MSSEVTTAERSRAVLLWSGVLGFALGVAYADWQVSIETGQVLAGLVHYPPDNPFFIYHATLWTLMNQLSALALWLHVPEIAASVIVSGLLGMMSFQALALVVFALAGDAVLAVAAPCVIFLARTTEFGVVYPIALVGTPHTYGAIGLAFIVLTAALVATGWPRLGGFLIGLAPAVHPSLGAWLILAVGGATISDWRGVRSLARKAWVPMGAGLAATVASYLVQRSFMPSLPHLEAAEASRYMTQFVSFWDGHRAPVNPRHLGVWLNAGVLVVSLAWLTAARRMLSASQAFLLRFVAVSALMSLGLAAVTQLPVGDLPQLLLILMPARVLNIGVFMSAAVVIGLLGASRRRVIAGVALVASLLVLLGNPSSVLWHAFGTPLVYTLSVVVPVTLFVAMAILVVLAFTGRRAADADLAATAGRRGVIAMSTRLILAVAILVTLVICREQSVLTRQTVFRDRTNERLFGVAAAGSGLLLTAGDLHLMQLRTRRPVLLDGGGLDGLMYAIDAAPAIDRILRDVYGLDLFNPPPEARGGGRVPMMANRGVWEGFSLEKWRAIRRTYAVTEVLTPSDWQLQLPPVVSTNGLRLYAIPQ